MKRMQAAGCFTISYDIFRKTWEHPFPGNLFCQIKHSFPGNVESAVIQKPIPGRFAAYVSIRRCVPALWAGIRRRSLTLHAGMVVSWIEKQDAALIYGIFPVPAGKGARVAFHQPDDIMFMEMVGKGLGDPFKIIRFKSKVSVIYNGLCSFFHVRSLLAVDLYAASWFAIVYPIFGIMSCKI